MTMSASPVAQEIHYLSQLSGIPCRKWRHTLVSSKVLDPIFDEDPPFVEGHLFTDEGSDPHRAFDAVVTPAGGITRKLDCDKGICYLVATAQKPTFETAAAGLGLGMMWGVAPAAKSIFNYTVPQNFTWVVTCILFRSLPAVNDASLTLGATSSGDFRNDDFDVNGLSQAWLSVNAPVAALNTNTITPANLTAFTLLNKQVLFAFAGGDHVDLVIQRDLLSVPPTQVVHTVFHSYLTVPEAYDCLGQNLTKCDGIFTA